MPPNRTGCLCLRLLVNLAGSSLVAHAQHKLAQAAHLGPHQLPCLLHSLHPLMLHALQAQGIQWTDSAHMAPKETDMRSKRFWPASQLNRQST